MSSSNANNAANAPAQKRTISKQDWTQKLNSVNVSQADLNILVLNYLIIEGYKSAAEKFAQETGLTTGNDAASIEERMKIREDIQAGRIDEAIERVNELDPEILDTNPSLYFTLQRQKLIELIRNGQIPQAIEFARDELAARGEENPAFLAPLETTLSLLLFPEPSSSPMSSLLDMSQRQKTASELNAAILKSLCCDAEPKLNGLVKGLAWAQTELEERVNFPRIRDFVGAEIERSG